MKKLLLFAGAGAIALSSCTNEDVIDISKGNAITFRSAMALNSAGRGLETSTKSIEQFRMTAIDFSQYGIADDCTLFRNLDFNRGSDDVFKSTPEYMWYKDADLTFYAYAYCSEEDFGENMFNKEAEIEITADQATINNFSPEPKIKNQKDLVATKTNGTYENNSGAPMSLVFDHILSEISVAAKSDNPVYEFKVKGVKYCNMVASGNFDFNNLGTNKNIWYELHEDIKADYEVRYSEPITLNSTVQDISNLAKDGYAMLIPQPMKTMSLSIDPTNTSRATYIAVLLQIVNKESQMEIFPLSNRDKYAWACIPLSGEKWLPGHRMRYVLDFTKGAGYTDPNPDPDPKDPDNPDNPDPDLPGPEDPKPDPGKPILKGLIQYTVSVNPWTNDPDINHTLDFTNQ